MKREEQLNIGGEKLVDPCLLLLTMLLNDLATPLYTQNSLTA